MAFYIHNKKRNKEIFKFQDKDKHKNKKKKKKKKKTTHNDKDVVISSFCIIQNKQ